MTMDLWNAAFTTDPRAVKSITGKPYQGNSPKPYWLIQRATELFGPVGIGWGCTVKSERFERLSETDVLHVAVVAVWYVWQGKRSETFEQMGGTKAAYKTADKQDRNGATIAGKLTVDEDAGKKSVTDGMVKCLSMIGFAGDIFSGRWDDSKYVELARQFYDEKNKNGTSKGIGVHSASKDAFESLAPDWQAYIKDLAVTVENAFASSGTSAAMEEIEQAKMRDELEYEHLAALWSQVSSKARTAIDAETKK